MKRSISVVILFLFLYGALSVANASDKKGAKDSVTAPLPDGSRIAIVVADKTGGNEVDRVVGDMLTTALTKAGVHVIERQAIGAIEQEHQLVQQGVVDPNTATPAGKVLGVNYLLDVKATEFGIKNDRIGGAIGWGPVAGLQVRTSTARVVLDTRLIDTTTGRVLTAFTTEGKQVSYGGTLLAGYIHGSSINLGGIDIGSTEWSQSSLGKAARKAVNEIVSKLVGSVNAYEGSVLAVLPDGEAIVDLGGFDGLQIDDKLMAYRLSTVKDSQGNVVWTETKPLGELRVLEVQADRCKVSPVDMSVKLQEGDRVKIPEAPKEETRK
jgi:curli biogenesis system outer membrane secretion channel CsgG